MGTRALESSVYRSMCADEARVHHARGRALGRARRSPLEYPAGTAEWPPPLPHMHRTPCSGRHYRESGLLLLEHHAAFDQGRERVVRGPSTAGSMDARPGRPAHTSATAWMSARRRGNFSWSRRSVRSTSPRCCNCASTPSTSSVIEARSPGSSAQIVSPSSPSRINRRNPDAWNMDSKSSCRAASGCTRNRVALLCACVAGMRR